MMNQSNEIKLYLNMSNKTVSKLFKELVKDPENVKLECEIYNLTKFIDEFEGVK